MVFLGRRRFAQGALAVATLPGWVGWARADDVENLVAKPGKARLASGDLGLTDVWCYGGSVPGPVIRARQGTWIRRRFVNQLPQASTVHWHGIRIDNAMDGAAGVTQEPVEPGGTFDYAFGVPDAGTYWYHPHHRTREQMARGLYGALVVEEAEGAPEVDADQVLLVDDWRLDRDGQIAGGFGNARDGSHAGRLGNRLTVNGDGDWRQAVGRWARLRLRLVNTANARVFDLGVQGLEGWVIALDGMPLEAPRKLDRLELAPAQRADLLVDVTADEGGEAFVLVFGRNEGYALASFSVGEAVRAARREEPGPLPANPVAEPGPLVDARRVELLMEGGAMGGMRHATLEGRGMGMRELVAAGKFWAFNGVAERPAEPLIEVQRGETVRIDMINDTMWPHVMHLHGHHFRQIEGDSPSGPLRDTLLVGRRERAGIAFMADNPGDWLLHCHMLEHSASGMMTWLRVA